MLTSVRLAHTIGLVSISVFAETKRLSANTIRKSPLASLVTCSPDSTYLVFAFSYSCPFCLNSIGNVNQYTEMHAVDRVIGLALDDTVAQARFDRLFDINFEIRNFSQMKMTHLSTKLPVTYIVRHDTIISQYTGQVVSPALLIP